MAINEDNKNKKSRYYIKENVSLTEYKLYAHVYDMTIVNIPRPMKYDPEIKILTTINIGKMNIADYYGELAENISDELFVKIRTVIQILYDHNIVFPDITGYNFIECGKKIWIVDFGHAYFDINPNHTFVEKFIAGHNGWNPEFK